MVVASSRRATSLINARVIRTYMYMWICICTYMYVHVCHVFFERDRSRTYTQRVGGAR